MRSNYEITKKKAQEAFATQDLRSAADRFGLRSDDAYIYLTFLGYDCRIRINDGLAEIRRENGGDHEEADYDIALALYDILSRPGIRTAPVNDFVSMQHLAGQMHAVSAPADSSAYVRLASVFDSHVETLKKALENTGAQVVPGADVSAVCQVFGSLRLMFRFWSSDDEFAPQIQFFWDRDVLGYMHYETVWYVNSAFLRKLHRAFTELS